MHPLNSLYARWVTLLEWLQAPFLLAIRLYWGGNFILTGWGKVTNLPKITDYFSSLGIPFPHANACAAATVETLGGFLLLIGLGSRIVTVPLLFVLGVAYATAESDSLKAIWTDPDKFTAATPFLFALACLIVLLFGPGPLSIDAWIGHCREKKAAA